VAPQIKPKKTQNLDLKLLSQNEAKARRVQESESNTINRQSEKPSLKRSKKKDSVQTQQLISTVQSLEFKLEKLDSELNEKLLELGD
jgi:hypothetical protein